MEGWTGGSGVSGGRSGRSTDGLADKELVDAVLRDLNEAADRWEAVVAQAATITYTADVGDVQAVANCDGRLIGLTLHPDVVSDYRHHELAERLNSVFAALRDEAQADYQARYGGTLH